MSEPLTAIVVDDEERARRRLTRMLGAFDTLVRVVGQAACGEEAVALIQSERPQVVFLDVQMPDLDGFAVLERLDRPPRYVVFTTAYDRYALDAFAVGAVDYLLKPFGERELARAVTRAVERDAEARFREGYRKMLAALERPRHMESIPVTYLKDIVLLPTAEITHFVADRAMVAIHTREGQGYTTELTLAELEEKLDPRRFFRAHRSAIINLDHLVRLEPVEGARYVAVLDGDARVEVSRTASRRLRERLGI
jgi:two-component system LytT family response regulator